MISRVAESCFWLFRYIERMDNTARMVDVNQAFILDTQLDLRDAWQPLLLVAGEAPRFAERHGPGSPNGEVVQRYLTWDRENPVSIHSSARWARENARTIRESISREMWECLNRIWLWLDQGAGRRAYERDRAGFFERIKEGAQLFRGVAADTMLHEEPYEFMQLGLQIERAGMTARILDVKHEMLALQGELHGETPRELAQCHAILRSCSAAEPFLKRGRSFNGGTIASFLVGDESFPRSIRHCLSRACVILDRIRGVAEDGAGCAEGGAPGESCSYEFERLLRFVVETPVGKGSSTWLHTALTHIIESLASIGDDLNRSFFAPTLPEASGAQSDAVAASGRAPETIPAEQQGSTS